MKRTLYHLFDRFDVSHCLLGVPSVALFFIPYYVGLVFGPCWFFGFIIYEIHQSQEKGDDAWPAIKGFLFGTMVTGLLVGLGFLIVEVF